MESKLRNFEPRVSVVAQGVAASTEAQCGISNAFKWLGRYLNYSCNMGYTYLPLCVEPFNDNYKC